MPWGIFWASSISRPTAVGVVRSGPTVNQRRSVGPSQQVGTRPDPPSRPRVGRQHIDDCLDLAGCSRAMTTKPSYKAARSPRSRVPARGNPPAECPEIRPAIDTDLGHLLFPDVVSRENGPARCFLDDTPHLPWASVMPWPASIIIESTSSKCFSFFPQMRHLLYTFCTPFTGLILAVIVQCYRQYYGATHASGVKRSCEWPAPWSRSDPVDRRPSPPQRPGPQLPEGPDP